MKNIRMAVLYTALALGANLMPGVAQAGDHAQAEALRAGDMKKLNFLATPKPVPDTPFLDAEGESHSLKDYRGKWVVLNFWATWCAPCRKEMPTLDALQAKLGGDKLQVLPIATIRNTLPAVQRFFASDKIEHLPIRIDPQARLGRQMGVFGLPVTLIVNPEGQEVARLIGEADWASPSAFAVLGALTGAKAKDAR